MTNKHLREWYLEYNIKYFRGRLPIDIDLRIKQPPTRVAKSISKSKKTAAFLTFDDGTLGIWVSPVVARWCRGVPSYALMSLLHEMAHLKLYLSGKSWQKHGLYFQKEMKRLAQIGALNTLW